MQFPEPKRLVVPVEPYAVSDRAWRFNDQVQRRFGLPARHLGDDIVAEPGTPVRAIGDGEVVLARTLKGSEEKRSWGGLIILGHRHGAAPFYSVYGHLTRLAAVRMGNAVVAGQRLGEVAVGPTPENGWWKIPHLHFAIYTGPWRGAPLPGYWRAERFWDTRLAWWHDPLKFIEEYAGG
jgi:murein DD-endopeptidase MepM/ murein hydrolase activator NlpD